MSHFFISYAREDKELAQGIAKLLDSEGFSVWWDPEIRVGEAFPDKIEREIFLSDHVMVLWSEHSVVSSWVRREARLGKLHNKLLPVQVDDCELPDGFKRLHTVRFDGYPELLEELYRRIGGGGFSLMSTAMHDVAYRLPSAPPAPQMAMRVRSWRVWAVTALVTAALVTAAIVIGGILDYSSVSTQRPSPGPPPPPPARTP